MPAEGHTMNIAENQSKTIFLNALEIASEADRQAYIEAQCAGDEALRREVAALVEEHQHVGSFLDQAKFRATSVHESSDRLGTSIGPYKLLQQIGEGGMGTVYMAEQTEPVQRKVALKIIKIGMDTRQVIVRFEAERQALALMDHPNIAKMLDAGTTETGRPYFVMELVKGVPINQYCDEHQSERRASGWSCSSRFARRCSMPIKKASSTAI